MKFFTSDWHINHKFIISAGKGRPFKSLDEMANVLIKNWNNKVSKGDDVYCLGDMFWDMNEYQIQAFMDKLNGNKHLITGNHDRIPQNVKSNRWVEITNYKELSIDHKKVVLSHFPIFEWEWFYNGSYHLHGHTHGTLNLAEYTLQRDRPNGNCWDVGVDNNNFEPLTFDEIKEKIDKNIKMLSESEPLYNHLKYYQLNN